MPETELGRAVVPIRATLDKLDADMADARRGLERGLAGVAAGAGAVLGAGVAAAAGLGALAAEAAPIEGIQEAFRGVADDADVMLAALRKGSLGMVEDAELMATYNEAAQLVGETFANQLPDAMEYLGKVAAATDQDMGFMLNSLVRGVGRLSPMILDNLGIQVDMAAATAAWAEKQGLTTGAILDNSAAIEEERGILADLNQQLELAKQRQSEFTEGTAESTRMAMAFKIEDLTAKLVEHKNELSELAEAHGTTVPASIEELTASMTKAQQQEALTAQALELLAENTAQMPDVADHAATKMAQLETTMANLKAEIGLALLPVFTEVLGILGELAAEYGPQVAEVLGRLGELLGPLLAGALEALIPALMTLMDTLIPLAANLMEALFPALSAVLSIVVQLAADLASQLAPVFVEVLDAILPVAVTLVEILAPVLAEIISRLVPVLVPLITELASVFTRLLTVIMPLVETLLAQLVPVFLEIIEALLPPLIDLFVVLLDIFVQYVEATLPNFISILEIILPILGELAVLIAEGVGLALEVLAGLIETVVQPIMDWWIRTILEPIIGILDRIEQGIKSVTEWFENLTNTIRDLDLPGWMTPGSPTPLEIGLQGISRELQRVDALMGGLNATATVQAVSAGAGAAGGVWTGDIIINGAENPREITRQVVQALQDRGIFPTTMLR